MKKRLPQTRGLLLSTVTVFLRPPFLKPSMEPSSADVGTALAAAGGGGPAGGGGGPGLGDCAGGKEGQHEKQIRHKAKLESPLPSQ